MAGSELARIPLLQGSLTVAALLQGVAAVEQLHSKYDTIRRRRGNQFLDEVSEQTKKDIDDLTSAIGDDDFLAELFEGGLDSAIRTAAEEKRWLLAKVVSAALCGDGLATPDELRILLRTVAATEPPDIQLLALIAQPRPGTGQLAGTLVEGAVTLEDLGQLWPEASTVFGPLLSVLQREGLVRTVSGTYATSQGLDAWALTPYGRRFIQFLPGGPFEVPDLSNAHLDVRIEQDGMAPVVRNLGLGEARNVVIETYLTDPNGVMSSEHRRDQSCTVLGPAQAHAIDATWPSLGTEARYVITLRWDDPRGSHTAEMVWSELRRSQDITFPPRSPVPF